MTEGLRKVLSAAMLSLWNRLSYLSGGHGSFKTSLSLKPTQPLHMSVSVLIPTFATPPTQSASTSADAVSVFPAFTFVLCAEHSHSLLTANDRLPLTEPITWYVQPFSSLSPFNMMIRQFKRTVANDSSGA